MRRLKIRYRKSASNDLAEIAFFAQYSGASAAIAYRYVDRIRATCRGIGDAPEGGRLRDDLYPGLRVWTFERRVVITYRVDARGVQIINVFNRGRDYQAFYATKAHRPELPA